MSNAQIDALAKRIFASDPSPLAIRAIKRPGRAMSATVLEFIGEAPTVSLDGVTLVSTRNLCPVEDSARVCFADLGEVRRFAIRQLQEALATVTRPAPGHRFSTDPALLADDVLDQVGNAACWLALAEAGEPLDAGAVLEKLRPMVPAMILEITTGYLLGRTAQLGEHLRRRHTLESPVRQLLPSIELAERLDGERLSEPMRAAQQRLAAARDKVNETYRMLQAIEGGSLNPERYQRLTGEHNAAEAEAKRIGAEVSRERLAVGERADAARRTRRAELYGAAPAACEATPLDAA